MSFLKFRRFLIISLIIVCIFGVSFSYIYFFQQICNESGNQEVIEESAKNIILMIGDGMGIGQITVARYSLGLGKNLTMDSFPYKGLVTTHSLTNLVTDSAAAATALATGHKTGNGIIAMTLDGEVLYTILESAESKGKSTGLVTTTRITHATPAAFAAHVMSRNQEYEIAQQMLEKDIEVLLGGGREKFAELLSVAENRGYMIIENRSQLLELNVSKVSKLLGLFAESHMSYDTERNTLIEPSLAEMTNVSLQILSKNDEGFFLMVEGGRIDHACHANDLNNTIGETLAFDAAVNVALQFAQKNEKTLVIVTADHETGGLVVLSSEISNSTVESIEVRWSTTGHTANMVPVFAYGPNASLASTFHDNTDIGKFLFESFGQRVDKEKNRIYITLIRYITTCCGNC